MIKTREKVKDALERKEIKVSDFVTINDDSDIVEAYVVKEIHGTTATIYTLDLTAEKDDIMVAEKIIALNELIHIDTSFVNVNGLLWQIRDKLLRGDRVETYEFLKAAI